MHLLSDKLIYSLCLVYAVALWCLIYVDTERLPITVVDGIEYKCSLLPPVGITVKDTDVLV